MIGNLKKTVEHESNDYTNCNWCSWYNHQSIDTRTRRLGNKRTSVDHPNYCIFEIGQNTEKSPRELKRLAVTQTPVKAHQLTLMRKTPRSNNNNSICTNQNPSWRMRVRKFTGIQTDYRIPARIPDLVTVNKNK